ncbi:putative Pentatricopeptide repeat-containing protein [Zostera marina]|uniref:Putative Pentatricopeptide repeat-containing protein n=1 Tax=Zostera marina TaxID=29655 RepID=A0A0K9NI37_ZOSMR|nr:putative Pentatricopeptide repeat-containing protein [Zostera marina]
MSEFYCYCLLQKRRSFFSSAHLRSRILQTEYEIVRMFKLPDARSNFSDARHGRRDWIGRDSSRISELDPSKRELDQRFIRILKIFKWGSDAEKAFDVMQLKLDHRLLRHVLATADIDIGTKSQFFKWAAKKPTFHHNSMTYMSYIHALSAANLTGEISKTISEFVKNPSCIITPSDLSAVIVILCRAKMVNKACSIFYQVKSRRICQPTVQTYNTMITMLIQLGQFEKVHELYTEMTADGNCHPDTATYEAIITTYSKLGRLESARQVFDELKEVGMEPRPKMYTNLISLYFRLGEIDCALDLFQQMRSSGCSPNVYTYTELIRGLGKVSRIDEALGLFCEMKQRQLSGDSGCKPDVVLMNNLLNLLGKSGHLDDMLTLFSQMEASSSQHPPNVVSFNTMIKALFDSNSRGSASGVRYRPSDVDSWLEKMKTRGISPSAYTYSILIDGYCKTNRVEKALLLLEEMDEKGYPPCPQAYCSLINTLGNAGRLEAASELFNELCENTCYTTTARVFAVMIKQLGKSGNLSAAVNLFEEMKRRGCKPDVYVYNALMSSMVRFGKLDEARSLMRVMTEQGCKPDLNSYNIILNGVGKCSTAIGGATEALDMLRWMKENVEVDGVSYNTVLSCLSHAGMFEEAAKLMKEMTVLGFEYDVISYKSILEAVGKIDEEKDPNG